MVEEKIKRETAKICPLKLILEGNYIVKEGWTPNYVKTKLGNLSRINIIGMVVGIENKQNFLIDDGTATINVLNFDNRDVDVKIGDAILIIGRIRLIKNSFYVVSEIINSTQTLQNNLWFEFRKKYLDLLLDNLEETMDEDFEEPPQIIQQETPQIIEFETPTLNTKKITPDSVINFIRSNDKGSGCTYDEIINHFGDDVETFLTELISLGELYEIKSGYLKVLE